MNIGRIITLLSVIAILFLSGCVVHPYHGGHGHYYGGHWGGGHRGGHHHR